MINYFNIRGKIEIKKNKKRFIVVPILLLFSVLLFSVSIGSVSAVELPSNEWNVTPGGSIQAAINNAGNDDTINVKDNEDGYEYTYYENVVVNKTGLKIRSIGSVIVQANDPNNPVFTINSDGSGSTVQNFIITGATNYGSSGILLEGATNCHILENEILGNENGITLLGSSQNTLEGNYIHSNYDSGIFLGSSPDNNLTGNVISENFNGIYLDMSGNNILRDNTLENDAVYNFAVNGNAEDFIQDIDTSNTIDGYPIYYLVGESNQTLEDIYGGYIALVNCNNITVRNSFGGLNDKGILLVNTTHSTIESSDFYYNIDGIYLLDSQYNTIRYNTVYQNHDLKKKSGIHLENSHYNTIYDNYVGYNNVGFSLIMSQGNLFYNNYVYGNFEAGIWVLDTTSVSNNLFGNDIEGNSVGIRVDSDSSTNLINFNRIVGNTECQLRYTGSNILNATCNWWGSNSAPTNGLGKQIEGLVHFSPWLVLNLTSNQTTMRPNSAVNITADLTHDSNGIYHTPTIGHIPDFVSVYFNTTKGIINDSEYTENGMASSILNIGSVSGIVDVSATVDNQIVHKLITIDNTAPYVSSIDPKNNAVNVAANKVIKITFTEDIKPGTLNIQLKNSAGTLIATTKTIAGKVLSITPTSALAESKYMLLLYAGYVTDLAGNPATAKTYNFIVGTSPTVTSIDPANYAVNVASDKIITVTFNEPIKAGNNNIQLKTNTGTLIPTTITISGNTVTITPTSPLAESRYVILIYAGSITDLAGNPVAAKTSSFSTGISPNVTSTDPSNYATNVATNKVITATFNEPIVGKYLTLVQLKNVSTGLVINTTKNVSGNTLTITPTSPLTANTRYLLMIYRYAVVDLVGNPNNSKSISFTTGII